MSWMFTSSYLTTKPYAAMYFPRSAMISCLSESSNLIFVTTSNESFRATSDSPISLYPWDIPNQRVLEHRSGVYECLDEEEVCFERPNLSFHEDV